MSYPAGQKLLFGFAVNDTTEPVMTIAGGVKWVCPFYSKWYDMLRRVNTYNKIEKNASYEGKGIHQEWHKFSSFKSWMASQDWEGKHLDKDVLGSGDVYGSEFCCFLPADVNAFVRGINFPAERAFGVNYNADRSVYVSRVYFDKKSINMGGFTNKYKAEMAYCLKKLECFKILESRHKLDMRVADSIKTKYEKLYEEAKALSQTI